VFIDDAVIVTLAGLGGDWHEQLGGTTGSRCSPRRWPRWSSR